jgi:prefoldin subunit 5
LLLKKQGRERVENFQEVIERLEKNEEEYRKEINDKDNEIIKLNREN